MEERLFCLLTRLVGIREKANLEAVSASSGCLQIESILYSLNISQARLSNTNNVSVLLNVVRPL